MSLKRIFFTFLQVLVLAAVVFGLALLVMVGAALKAKEIVLYTPQAVLWIDGHPMVVERRGFVPTASKEDCLREAEKLRKDVTAMTTLTMPFTDIRSGINCKPVEGI